MLKQCTKTIHGRTHRTKIKKPCSRQLPISKSLLVGTIIAIHLPSFTKKGVSDIKEKK